MQKTLAPGLASQSGCHLLRDIILLIPKTVTQYGRWRVKMPATHRRFYVRFDGSNSDVMIRLLMMRSGH